MKQEMMGGLGHRHIIFTSLQTDNHTNTISLQFFTGRVGCSSWRPTNSIKVLKAKHVCSHSCCITVLLICNSYSLPKSCGRWVSVTLPSCASLGSFILWMMVLLWPGFANVFSCLLAKQHTAFKWKDAIFGFPISPHLVQKALVR